MKKSVLLAALVAVAMPTMAQQVKYSVSGTYSDNGKKIYLIDKLIQWHCREGCFHGCLRRAKRVDDDILQRRHTSGNQCQ